MNLFFGNWFIAALAGMVSFACLTLTMKRLTYLLPVPIILFYLFAISAVLFLATSLKRGLDFNVGWYPVALLVLASVFSFAGNMGDIESLKLAPNPGYSSAVKAGQIIVLTFASLWLFPDQKLSLQGVLGVFFVFIGIGLLALQK
jgi:hypothetical protein